MTRIIKHRGKLRSIDSKEFIIGSLVVKNGKSFIYQDQAFPEQLLEVSTYSVGQFAERFDKNENEIYSGDILQDEKGFGVVEWSFVENGWVIKTEKEKIRFTGNGSFVLSNTIIVGNIFSCDCEEDPCMHKILFKQSMFRRYA